MRRLLACLLPALLGCCLLPAAARAHAYLIRTSPVASRVLDSPPGAVALTYDEAVEPRFAVVSVTDASGARQTAGAVSRSPSDPDTLVVPLRHGLPEGWYLVYWRAVSVDGHPVQGAFTFAVGPNPGPAPQFPVPHVSATAVTAPLLATRWLALLSLMCAVGLAALRLPLLRPTARALPGFSRRAVSRAALGACGAGLVAIPVYLEEAFANDSLRSVLDVGTLVPLFGVTQFGRGWLDTELCLALFTLALAVALWLDRPDRRRRSVAELAAGGGVVLAGVAMLILPGAVGHAGQASPRGLAVAMDLLHLVAGAVWIGGLVGLLVLWASLGARREPGAPSRLAVLADLVPRFSTAALVAVGLLLASGTMATIIHLPAVQALWDTGYGRAILVKIGLLVAAVALGAVNLLRTRPRLLAAREAAAGESATGLLARLVGGEVAIVAGAVFTAALLGSLPPPPPAFALQSSALAHVGPGRVEQTIHHDGYTLQVLVTPNKAAAPDDFALRITRGGAPVRGATVTLAFNHLEMEMPQQQYQLREVAPGVYRRSAPALVMVGRWGLSFQIAPPGGQPFTALIVDQAGG